MKYVIKESELKTGLKEIGTEEIKKRVNESISNALTNTLKAGALTLLDPAGSVGRAYSHTLGLLNGKESISNDIKNFFGNGSSTNLPHKKTKFDKQRDRLAASRGVSYEYGKPETIPGRRNKIKLVKKSEFLVPVVEPNENGQYTTFGSRTGDWGSFGKHYHDVEDRMWQRIFTEKENALIRNSRGDERKMERLKPRYKKILIKWLKSRDRDYELYAANM